MVIQLSRKIINWTCWHSIYTDRLPLIVSYCGRFKRDVIFFITFMQWVTVAWEVSGSWIIGIKEFRGWTCIFVWQALKKMKKKLVVWVHLFWKLQAVYWVFTYLKNPISLLRTSAVLVCSFNWHDFYLVD